MGTQRTPAVLNRCENKVEARLGPFILCHLYKQATKVKNMLSWLFYKARANKADRAAGAKVAII
jgi:hypothetical protein